MENKKGSKPFYALPEKTPTSSQIVNAARSSLRTFDTRRPNTPRDEQRHLFPSSTNRTPETRPPSAFSLTSRHFEGADSRPVSGTRLSPLDYHPKPITPSDVENILIPRPPSAEPSKVASRRGSGNRARLPSTLSLEGVENSSSEARPGQGDDYSSRESTRDKVHAELVTSDRGDVLTDQSPTVAGSRESSAGSRKSSAGKSSRNNSAGRRDVAEPEDVYTTQVEPLVTELAQLSRKKDCDHIYELAGQLYTLLESLNCFTKQFQYRAKLLQTIFRLLDVDEARVLLRLARIILAFKVSGKNLLNVCKLVFKVSRNEENDAFFLEENILNLLLETIRNADPTSSWEALIYCVGSVKFLTGNGDVLKRLAKLDCVKTLAALMHSINKLNRDSSKPYDQYGHILVQLTAALRNLADTSSGRDRFLTHNVIDGLVHLMDTYPGDSDLMMYISRILSKITLHSDCCLVLANQQLCYKVFVNLLKKHLTKDDLIVRLCFVLGNLTIKNDVARLKLFQEKDSLDTLLLLLQTYLELDQQGKKTASVNGESPQNNGGVEREKESEVSKVEDVLIKVMRVLANLTINEEVGPTVGANSQFMKLLLKVVDQKDIVHHEEVVVNAVVAINNLSYYTTQDESQMASHLSMAATLLKLIMNNNMDGILEAARVFGNLTRHREIRDFLSQNKVDAIMVTLLDSNSREMVYIACGVLINFMLDEEKRPMLKREGGIKKLIEVLRDFGREDWQLSGCVCKVLVNYSCRIHSSANIFGQEEATELSELLTEYLDKESALGESLAAATDEEMREYIEELWHEEFLSVGTQLWKRIVSHLSPLEPLEAPS